MKMDCKIIGARVITPYRIIEDGEICIAQGKILSVGQRHTDTDAESETFLDAGGRYAAPGFVDIHTHGAGGHDFMDCTPQAFLEAAKMYVRHGATTVLPTTLACPGDELLRMIDVFESVRDKSEGANLYGLHLEGPYFAMGQRGAQDPAYIHPPREEEYREILAASQHIVRWSAAPELPGSAAFASCLRQEGVLPSIGHSDAEYNQVVEAFECGFRHVTHLYSGMSGMVRRNSYRYPGVIESAYMLDEMTVEIIADGRHLPPSILSLVYRSKGPDKTALVTDSMRAAGMPDGKSILGSLSAGQEVIVEEGVAKMPDRTAFAGSVATADRLVRNMVQLAHVPLIDAVRMMTSTPARIASISSKGILAGGYDADVVLFDDDVTVWKTLVGGKVVYTAPSSID